MVYGLFQEYIYINALEVVFNMMPPVAKETVDVEMKMVIALVALVVIILAVVVVTAAVPMTVAVMVTDALTQIFIPELSVMFFTVSYK